MDCTKVKETLFLFFDNEMDQTHQTLFEQHLSDCPQCARRMRYTRQLLILVKRSCGRQPAPTALRLRIVTRLRLGGAQTLH